MRAQKGFTLIELLSATSATMVVIAAATAFMLKGLSWYDELNGKIEMNRHARETFNLLAFGGRSASTGNDGTRNVYGIHGRENRPTGGLRNNGSLEYESNDLTLRPDRFASMSVPCTGAGLPIPDCTTGATRTVTGWLGNNVSFLQNATSIDGKTVGITMTITNSFQAQRAESPAMFTDTYRTVMTLNRDEDDP